VLEGIEAAFDDEEEEEEEYPEEEFLSPSKRRKTPPSTPIPSTPSTPSIPMPGSIKRKTVSIMKATREQTISMKDLNDSAARLGLNNQVINVGQLSVPILRGAWQKKLRKVDDEGDFVTSFKDFNLIRILPHTSVSLKQCDLIWLNPQQLKVGIVWPKWFKSAKRQIAFQTGTSTHKFDEDHDIIDSLQDDINNKKEAKKDKKSRIIDFALFEFELPQDTSKAGIEITILNVKLEADDLDADEEMPPGAQVKVLQIITQQKMDDEEDNLLDVTQRDVKLGNYKLNCIVLNDMSAFMLLTFILSSFFIYR
jgi:hypothetical protein